MPPARRRVEVRACLYPLVADIVRSLEAYLDQGSDVAVSSGLYAAVARAALASGMSIADIAEQAMRAMYLNGR